MPSITITINATDAQAAGLRAARENYNENLPEVRTEPDEDGKTEVIDPNPNEIDSDEDYLTRRVEDMLQSYAATWKTDITKIDEQIVALQASKSVAEGKIVDVRK